MMLTTRTSGAVGNSGTTARNVAVAPSIVAVVCDDALDVRSVHGILGIIGSLTVGIFASSMINPAGPNGALFGNPSQFGSQLLGVGVAIILGFGGTWIILKVIKAIILSHTVEL